MSKKDPPGYPGDDAIKKAPAAFPSARSLVADFAPTDAWLRAAACLPSSEHN